MRTCSIDPGAIDKRLVAPMRFIFLAVLAAVLISSPAFSEVEQNCRFIQAKPEREACYKRQEAALAEKRKQAAARQAIPPYSPERMSQEDAALKAQLRGICRGC